MYKPIPANQKLKKNALTVAKSLEIIRNNMTKSFVLNEKEARFEWPPFIFAIIVVFVGKSIYFNNR